MAGVKAGQRGAPVSSGHDRGNPPPPSARTRMTRFYDDEPGGKFRVTCHTALLNPLTLAFLQKLLSGSIILLTITFKLRMILQNIRRRVIVNVLINILPSNISLTLLLPT